MKNRVVITGMGCVTSNASNLAEFKESLLVGESGIHKIPELENLGFRCHVGGIAKLPETLREYYQLHRLYSSSDFIRLACIAGVEAWKNADLEIPDMESNEVDWDTGIIIGTTAAAVDEIANKVVPLTNSKKVKRIGGYGSLNIMGNGPSNILSSILATGNLNSGNSVACCTGTNAILDGFFRIQSGRAKRMVVGGSEGYSHHMWACLDAMRVLNSQKNDTPKEASRPMSESASGFVPASGAGILILEDLNTALDRGAPIIAEILGGAMNSGGHRNGGTSTFPNNDGVLRCISTALERSKVKVDEIDAINGHLTGTKADPNEIQNWATIFKDVPFPHINATKGMIGHTLGASGAIESIAGLLQIQHQFLHPSINCEDPHPEILKLIPEKQIVRKTKTNAPIQTLIKSSFGFGDVNSTIIYKRFDS